MSGDSVTAKGILVRALISLVVVYATFNPEGYSFFHWALNPVFQGQMEVARTELPIKLLAGLLLLGVWIFFVQTTRRSIGWKGALLVLAILGTLVWALIDGNLLKPGSSRAIGHIVLIALALVLTLGMSWSHISRRVSGQIDTDDVN